MFENSSVSDVDTLDYWSDVLAEQLRPVLVIIASCLILGTLGNVFVMYIYWFGNKSPNEDRFFIPFLALFDICTCAVCSGSEIITEVRPLRFDNNTVCKMMAFSSIAFATMSSHLLLLITIDRYLKICTPFRPQMTLRRKKLALAVIVCAGVAVSLPSVIVYGSVSVTMWQGNVTGRLCINVPSGEERIWHLTYKTVMFIYGSAHFLALVVLYILILRSIYIRSRARLRLQSGQWQCPAHDKKGRGGQGTEINESSKQMGNNCQTETPEHSKGSIYSNAPINDGSAFPEEPVSVADDRRDSTPTPSDQDSGGQQTDEGFTMDTGKSQLCDIQTNQDSVPNTPQVHRQNTKLVKSNKHLKIKGLRLTLVFLVISIIYAITICLKLVLMTMESVKESFWTTMTPSEFVCFRFLYSAFVINFIVNPFVYGFLDREFQRTVKERCICR
ncbi:cholecystokinin receptor-like [Pecten maximus]|uniref:cholecystokinin receptor-like n=1 Tax=Pecten maximus TaxID=6579 RepID=UPI00145825BB|nr:cholecystokinin receptor-like [Pecten maximus]